MKGPKLYSWHAPEIECPAKRKARTPYEFDVEVWITITIKAEPNLGARSFPNKPYVSYTLNEQLEQAQILSDGRIGNVYVDRGYLGVDADNPTLSIKHREKSKLLTEQERAALTQAAKDQRTDYRSFESRPPHESLSRKGANL